MDGSDAEGRESVVLLSRPFDDDDIMDTVLASPPIFSSTEVMDNAASKNAEAKIHQGQKDDAVPRVDVASSSADATQFTVSEQLDEDVDDKPVGIVVGSPRIVDDNLNVQRGAGEDEDEEKSADCLSPLIAETTSDTKLITAKLIATSGEEGGAGHDVSSPQMMATDTPIPPTNDHDIMENFHIQSPNDKKVFQTVLGWLQEYESNTIPTNVVAATLTLIVKGLAVHGAGLASGHFLGGNLRVLTDFVRYQSSLYGRDNGIFSSSSATTPPVTLVQLARHCSDIVNKWGESEGLYCHFMEFYDFGSARETLPVATTPSSENVLSFQQMLLNTLSCIHLNTIESLEDLSDFEHLWSSTLNDFRSNSIDEASGGRKRTKSNDDAVNIRLVAKELAWILSRSSYYSHSKIDENRKQRILRAASCIDFVVAALMAPIIAGDRKQRRFEFGNIDPRRSIEDEAAAALSSMHLGGGCTFDTGLREKSKKMLLKAASDLLSSVTVEPSSILHKDIVRCAQQVALTVLSLLEGKVENISLSEGTSPASQLLSLFISHKVRQENLDVLKESYASAISDKVTTELSELLDEIHPLNMSWIISKLQRNTFTVSIFNLSMTERKFVAPFAPRNCPQEQRENPLRAEAMIYCKQTKPTMCNSIQISRVKNPTKTEDELNEVNEWITSLHKWPTYTSSVKPSSWLVSYFRHHTEGLWNKIVIPVLNFFLENVAGDCQLDSDVIAEDGVYNTKQGNEYPGAVLRLYYSALESIIRNKRRADHDNSRGNLDDKRFHSSLFSLCYFTLQKAKDPDGRCFLIEDIGECPVAFAKLVDLFIEEFQLRPANELSEEPNHQLSLPSYLSRVLSQLKEMTLTMIWMEVECDTNESTSFLNMVIEMRSNDPEKWSQTCSDAMKHTRGQSVVCYVIHNLIDVTRQRTTDMCELLLLPCSSSTTEITMDLFQNLLHYRTEIFYNRHPDQLMLCCLYASICAQSKHGPVVNFQRIADTYTEVRHDLGSEVSYAILYRIKNCSDRADEFGDIVSLYNEVFLSCVKYLWRTIKKTGQQSKIDDFGHDSDTVDSFEHYSIVLDDETIDVSSPETSKKKSNARSSDDDTTSIDSKDKMDVSDGSEDDHGCESETVARGKVEPSEKKATNDHGCESESVARGKVKPSEKKATNKHGCESETVPRGKVKPSEKKSRSLRPKPKKPPKPKIVQADKVVVSKVATDPSDKQRIADAIAAVNDVYGVGHERERRLLEARLRGVTQRPSRKWQAQLYYAGKSRYIGVFDNKEQAALAYEIAREILKDEKQPLNVTADECEKNVNLAREAAFEGIGLPTHTVPSPPLHLCGSKDELVGANVYVYKGQFEGRTGTLLDRKTTGWCTIDGIESKVQISFFAVVDDGKINLRVVKGTPRVMPRIMTPDEVTKALSKFREEGPSKDITKSE